METSCYIIIFMSGFVCICSMLLDIWNADLSLNYDSK